MLVPQLLGTVVRAQGDGHRNDYLVVDERLRSQWTRTWVDYTLWMRPEPGSITVLWSALGGWWTEVPIEPTRPRFDRSKILDATQLNGMSFSVIGLVSRGRLTLPRTRRFSMTRFLRDLQSFFRLSVDPGGHLFSRTRLGIFIIKRPLSANGWHRLARYVTFGIFKQALMA